MTNLGSHHHDFPHLAKQTGFCFQLHKGKVNWVEIESLNINEIVKNRNFQLLEKNLTNVINCNLEKEYDLKDVDQNFVKLFKLAQLGVDYLSYCEAYLDKCVVILQEQLIAFQEECESLKYGKEKREEQGSKRRKNKTKSYQCEKCDKVFISDVYLKFHDKRRHNIPSTPKRFDESPKACTDSAQQTEGEEKSTTSTQTALLNMDRATTTEDDLDTENIKAQDGVKMENLEREILHLKERLKKAENAFMEKTETSAGFPSPCPNPTCHNTMLLLLPSSQGYPSQTGSADDKGKPGFPLSAPEILQRNSSQIQVTIDQKVKNKLSSEDPFMFNSERGKIFKEEENGSPKTGTKFNDGKVGIESRADCKGEMKEDLDKGEMECEKENLDPNKGAIAKLSKPLPPPRKSKKVIPAGPATENSTMGLFAPKRGAQAESEAEGIVGDPAGVISTSVKRKSGSDVCERSGESLSGLNKEQSISKESLDSRKSALIEDSSTSFFKTIVGKKSPKFRTFGQNLRRSLINLCDSVSSTGKDFVKKKSVDQNAKVPVMSRLNNRLRQMGVDPEWSGIPKKTMRQKLSALKHRRKLLIKENPMYPLIRENIEEAITEKLKKNLGGKNASTKKSAKQIPVSDEHPTAQHSSPSVESEGIRPQRCVMYDIDSDSESKSSDSEIEFEGTDVTEQNVPPETPDTEKEFDLTVFQVGRGSFKEKDVTARVEELLTDSDIDGDFSDEKHFKALNGLLTDRKNGERGEHSEGENKSGDRGPLNSANRFHSTLQLNAKKKVWFVGDSDDFEEGLSDGPTGDEDLWSLKSDWEKNLG